MRKDVRLVLGVCSVLLFAVLVYVLFFTGPGAKKNVPVASGGGSASAGSDHGGSTAAPPVRSDTGSGAIGITPVAPVTPSPVTPVNPTTRPTEPVNPIAVVPPAPSHTETNLTPLARGESFDWNRALNGGVAGTNTAPPVDGTASSSAGTAHGARKYQVKPNETLWGIARAEYGNAAYVNQIIRANPGMDANRLRAGAIIVLPEVTPETNTQPAAAVAPVPVDQNTQYRVQSGDNLFTIAKKLYGNINRAGKLYEANKDIIGPNPNALKLNMVLRLPDPPTVTPPAPAATPATPAVSDIR